MAELSGAAETAPSAPTPADNWSEAWSKALEKSMAEDDAAEKGAASADTKRLPESKATDVSDQPDEAVKAKEGAAEDAKDGTEGDEVADEEALEDSAPIDETKARAELEALAKKLGLRLDNAAITTEERVGFRAEKRKWREKRDVEEQQFKHQLAAAENFYAPMLKAKQAFEAGDIDGALIAMGIEGGLSEANTKLLEREAGKDPRVTALQKELEAERKARREREEREEALQQQMHQERAEREALQEIGSELKAHPKLSHLSANEWFARGVLTVQRENWDGFETLSTADAAVEYINLLKQDPKARFAYEALQLAFGGQSGRGAKSPERQSSEEPDSVVGRSNESSVKAGEKPPKTLSKRKAVEASPPESGLLDEKAWMAKYSAAMRQSAER